MRMHLMMCKSCAVMAQHLRALRDPLLGMPDPELPEESLSESARERLQAALRQAASES